MSIVDRMFRIFWRFKPGREKKILPVPEKRYTIIRLKQLVLLLSQDLQDINL